MTPQALNGAESKLPYEPEAERQVIAAALLSPEEVVPVLRKELAASLCAKKTRANLTPKSHAFAFRVLGGISLPPPSTGKEVIEMQDKKTLLLAGVKGLKNLQAVGYTIPQLAIEEMRKLIAESPNLSFESVKKKLLAIYEVVLDYKTTRVKSGTRVR